MAAALIRLAREADAAAVAALYRPFVEETRISFEVAAPDASEIAARMANPLLPWLVAEQDGAIVGFASSAPMRARRAYRWSVETGIYLAPEVQRQGLGRALFGELLGILEKQGYVAAFATIGLPNDASVSLHQAMGFVHIGTERGCGFKLGQWVDVSRWQRDLAPRPSTPSEPRPYADL